jgi:hypothetical protein
MRLEPRPSHVLDSLGLALLRAEETIALVERSTPGNGRSEVERLLEDLERGRRLRPAFVYDGVPDLGALRRGLERLAREAAGHGRIGALYQARAEELELEACLAEHVGTVGFRALAGRRFCEPRRELEPELQSFLEEALAVSVPCAAELHASDDRGSPASLVTQLRRRAAELALSIRVEIRARQLATAATGHGVVGVRPGVLLSAEDGARIAVHELLAHALPRARSVHAPFTLLRAGTAGSVEFEEGRALLVESRAGHLGPGRRRELALRHVAALGVRHGAAFEETVRELVLREMDARRAIDLAARVHRGGGLAREIAYLPAYLEVRATFDREPDLERWFERGRVGLDAARELALLGEPMPREAPLAAQNPLCTV